MGGKFAWFSKLLPGSNDDPGRRYFKLTIYLGIGIIVVMIVSSLIAFFLTIEGEEQTLVPEVRGMELADAMMELQDKGLTAEVQLRVSRDPSDKGTVLAQDPDPGALVKVGRKIDLRVSKGPVIDVVENFVGMNLSEVELQLQSLSTIYGEILRIKKPVMEVYSDSSAGTILEQKPPRGTKINDLTDLELVVSKGPQGSLVTVEDYIGIPFYEALAIFARTNAPFVFLHRSATVEEEPGTIVSQSPSAGTDVEPGTLMQFYIATPENIPENMVFDILERKLPDYAVPINLSIEVINPAGDRRLLASMKHPGGLISIPYLEEANSQIVVTSSLQEMIKYTIRMPVESAQ
ncbi:MAG: PASTA domain-containing protein [Spirochaetales bacterium]|jgi:eukaryotic-like serine/threonine-protein kinase|nr:PASTA domain-containing protein [Spirochaetales bacterium]